MCKKILVAGLVALSMYSLNAAPGKTSEEIGIRKAPVNDEKAVVLNKYEFPSEEPGSSKRYQRAYDNAPPQIPHSTEGLFPITKDNNACMGCHMPDVATDVGATPIPESHFYDFRKKMMSKNGELVQSRFNCNQCHVPQAKNSAPIANNFKPEFFKEEFKNHSHLMQSLRDAKSVKEK